MDDNELAACVKDWRARYKATIREAAEAFGMSKRTLEGIEQGRGFHYRVLLLAAMKEIGQTQFNWFDRARRPSNEPAADAGTSGKGTGDRHRHTGSDAQGRRDFLRQHRSRTET